MSTPSEAPYNTTWLDSCYRETLLPRSPWQQIKDALNSELAIRVQRLSPEADKSKLIISLLGQHFVDDYLHSGVHQLSSPTSQISAGNPAHTEAWGWIKAQISEIIRSLKLQAVDCSEPNRESLSGIAVDYMTFAQHVVYRGLGRELYKVEKDAHNNNIFPISGPQSEALGSAVTQILQTHPNRLRRICQQLNGQQLPNSLRILIWKIKIYKADTLQDAKSLETFIADADRQFSDAVAWGMQELGVNNSSCSPVDGVIRHAVREIYQSSPAIQGAEMMKACSKMATDVLNILYVHKRAYEPHYALLLLPLIWTYIYGNQSSNKEVSSMKLAELLFYLIKNCFPSRLEIFSAADRVISRLHREDSDLYQHLCTAMQKNTELNPREFLVNFIHMERERALEKSIGDRATVPAEDAKNLLSHPIILMRKWIGEGFAGVLDLSATLFIWDQCFLSDWAADVLECTCLVLLQLLRVELLKTSDYQAVKRVLLNNPSRLYTRDIQQALVYMRNGGALADAGNLRQPSQIPESKSPSIQSSTAQPSIPQHTPTPRTISAAPSIHPPPQSAVSSTSVDLGDFRVERASSDTAAAERVTNEEAFDIYIDEVRFIPDNATVVKVTGRILDPLWRKPTTLDLPDIEAFSTLDSPARCPRFHFRYRVGSPATGIPTDITLLLRVYTVNVTSAELLVIGNCCMRLFKEHDGTEILKTGGYQRRLTHELPSTVSRLTESAFEENAVLPAVTILFRILLHSEDFVEPPGYASGFYDSSAFQPSDSEWRLYSHYKAFEPYPPTVREAIRDILEEEQQQSVDNATDQMVDEWYRQRTRKAQLQGKPAKSIDLREIAQYDQKQGICIMVEQAFSLPSAQFVNVLIHTSEGPTARRADRTYAGFRSDEVALLKSRDFSSLQKSPRWTDEPKVFHPHYDQLSSLVIRLYSLDATYEPRADRAGPGAVREKKGRGLALVSQGWAVLPLFYKKSVNVGRHHLPILQDSPSMTFLEFLSSHPGDVSLREAIRQQVHQLQGTSSVVIRLWDGHFTKEDCIPLPAQEELLTIGKPDKFKNAMAVTSGKPLSDLVLQSLPRQERRLGMTGQPYITEQQYYEEAMNMVFTDKMVDTLLHLGLSPLD